MVYFSKRLPSGCSQSYLVSFSTERHLLFPLCFPVKTQNSHLCLSRCLCVSTFLWLKSRTYFRIVTFQIVSYKIRTIQKISLSYALFGRLERWKNFGHLRLTTFAMCSLFLFYVSILYTIKIKIILITLLKRSTYIC